MLDVAQLWRASVEQDPHGVEAKVFGLEVSFREVVFGEGTDRGSFARGNRLERVTVGGAAPQFDLHEDQGRAVAQDQVDLAVARAVVALYEDEAPLFEVRERQVLAPPSGGAFSLQGATPA